MALALEKRLKTPEILSDLENLLQRLGIGLEYRSLKFDGGLCFFQKKPLVILNRSLVGKERASALIKALKKFNLDEIYMPDRLRDLIEEYYARESSDQPNEK